MSPWLLYIFLSELLSYRTLKCIILEQNFSRNFLTLNITFEYLCSVLQNEGCTEVFLDSRVSTSLLVEVGISSRNPFI